MIIEMDKNDFENEIYLNGDDDIEYTVWSVEIEANWFYDDLFLGSYSECIEYCNKADTDEFYQIAKIGFDKKGNITRKYEVIKFNEENAKHKK